MQPLSQYARQKEMPISPFEVCSFHPIMTSPFPFRSPLAAVLLFATVGCMAADTPVAAPPPLPSGPTIPATQKGNGYDWMARHKGILKLKDVLNPDLVFIGDSITHFWGGGQPGDHAYRYGEPVLKSLLGKHRVLNLGFGSDRTQHVLWRLQQGELDSLNPAWVVINIGTNNTSDSKDPTAIMSGIQAVSAEVRQRVPKACIILMAIFPREEKPEAPRRKVIDALNRRIESYAAEQRLVYLDIGKHFLDAEGRIIRDLMPDFVHPREQGYRFWAEALLPIIEQTAATP